ncbi:MAG: hypothetical protein K5773_00175 [Pseudobutyrivibrio sp.]|nr:hypothetical protein [Pseudobutyrivibrio sp.]
MSAFLSSFFSYLIKMIILICLGMMGGFIGIKLRKYQDRKKEADNTSESSSQE